MGELYHPFPKLPKNIRQIGENDTMMRFYIEDYVNTYLKRLHPMGTKTMRVGLLLGNVEYHEGMPYIFVDGALELEDIETQGEKVLFSESAWKKAYQSIEEAFPKRTIQGWFLCGGQECQLSPLNYWKQHSQYFAGKNQVMYLNHGLEGEESIYVASEDGFYRLKGHCIYYERNQMMQDYMITRKDARRVESASQETVIKDFRARLSAKKDQASAYHRTVNAMGMLCGVLAVAVLAGGVALVNNYTKMQQMESVLVSVLPEDIHSWDEYQQNQLVIEEVEGMVYPTDVKSEETGEFFSSEMSEEAAESGDETQSGLEETDFAHTESERGTVETFAQNASSNQNVIETEHGQGDISASTQQIDYVAAAANGYKVYIVGEGETLYGICWKHYDSLLHLDEICRLNQLSDVNRILAGQKLILP